MRPISSLLPTLWLAIASPVLAAPALMRVPVPSSSRALPAPPDLAAPSLASGAEVPASVPDGRWHAFGLLQTENNAALYDPDRDRLISLGGDHAGAWELSLTGTVAWRELVTRPGQPWPVGWWASEYVPETGDLYFEAVGQNRTVVVCRMDPTTGAFEPIQAAGAPEYPYIPYMTMAYDAAHQRFFLFGGQNYDFQLPDDLWVLDLLPTPQWSKWSPAGPSPQGRIGAALVLDPTRNRLLMLGGLANVDPGVWALSLDSIPTWSQLSPYALPGDANPNGMVMDRAADRILAVHSSGEVWAFSLRTHQWTTLSVSGPRPPGRLLVTPVMDVARHRLLVAGGRSTDETDLLNDAWALSLDGAPRWTPLVSGRTRPPVRASAGDGFDAARRRLLMFGGANDFGKLNDTWALDLDVTRWSQVVTQGTPPPSRDWHASAYDPVRDQLVVYGGTGAPDPPYYVFSDLWTLSFAGDTPIWKAHEPPGAGPGARCLMTLTYDPPRDRFLLMFGSDGLGALGDVWELRFTPDAVWRLMSPSGSPPPRVGAMAAYDPARDRILLFGGATWSEALDDTWALDLATPEGSWYPIPFPIRPAPRALGLFHVDATRDRALLYGGEVGLGVMSDVWELPLTGGLGWRRLSPVGPVPAPRTRTIGAYDPVLDRLLFSSGGAGAWPYNDTWALEFQDALRPVQLQLTTVEAAPDHVHLVWTASEPGLSARLERTADEAVWHEIGTLTADAQGRIEVVDRDVRPGTRLEYRLVVVHEGEEFGLGLASVVVPAWSMALAIASPSPGVTFRLQLASGLPATLTAYDVTGRRVWSREVAGAGEREIHATDVAWRAGIYYARLVQADQTLRVRFAVVR